METTTASLLIGLLVIGAHEAAHFTTARWFGISVKRIGLSWKGIYILRESGPPRANMLTTLAGPLVNLLLAATWPVSHEFAAVNVIFGLANLIPMSGSDGQRAWSLLEKELRTPAV